MLTMTYVCKFSSVCLHVCVYVGFVLMDNIATTVTIQSGMYLVYAEFFDLQVL